MSRIKGKYSCFLNIIHKYSLCFHRPGRRLSKATDSIP